MTNEMEDLHDERVALRIALNVLEAKGRDWQAILRTRDELAKVDAQIASKRRRLD